MKNNNGVTLVILVITILVMIIITGTIAYNVTINMESTKITKLYTDLELLQDKISLYYAKYGGIPVKEEFTGSDNFKTAANPNDNDTYYIIDLSLIDNLTLNYNITNTGDDLYIINDTTHTIYYPKGLEIDGEVHYRLPDKYTKIEN